MLSADPSFSKDGLEVLMPLEGDLPPPSGFFPTNPPLPLEEFTRPTEEDLVGMDLVLPDWPMEARWNSLCDPPDRVATSIMTQGLTLQFSRLPPLHW